MVTQKRQSAGNATGSVVEVVTRIVTNTCPNTRNTCIQACIDITCIGNDYFFLCLFLRKRFLRLCVAILCLFLFLPLGMMSVF